MSEIEFTQHDSKQCYTLKVGPHHIGVSYETFISYDGPFGRFRTDTRHSQTTDRHHGVLGSKDWPRIQQAELEALVERAIATYGLMKVYERVGAENASGIVAFDIGEAYGPLPDWRVVQLQGKQS